MNNLDVAPQVPLAGERAGADLTEEGLPAVHLLLVDVQVVLPVEHLLTLGTRPPGLVMYLHVLLKSEGVRQLFAANVAVKSGVVRGFFSFGVFHHDVLL